MAKFTQLESSMQPSQDRHGEQRCLMRVRSELEVLPGAPMGGLFMSTLHLQTQGFKREP